MLGRSHSNAFTIAALTRLTWHAANRQRMGLGGPTQTGGWHQLGGCDGVVGVRGLQRHMQKERERQRCGDHTEYKMAGSSLEWEGWAGNQTNKGSVDNITSSHLRRLGVVPTRASITYFLWLRSEHSWTFKEAWGSLQWAWWGTSELHLIILISSAE